MQEKRCLLSADVVANMQSQTDIFTSGDIRVAVLEPDNAHEWLGCMLTARGSQEQHVDGQL